MIISKYQKYNQPRELSEYWHLKADEKVLSMEWETGSMIQSNRDSKFYVDDYAPKSYYDIGADVSINVFIKAYKCKNVEPSILLIFSRTIFQEANISDISLVMIFILISMAGFIFDTSLFI